MGTIHSPQPVLRLVPMVSRYDDALAWARDRVQQQWGELALVSPAFVFNDTDYYDDEMGTELKKQFVVTTPLMDPATLPEVKCTTNLWETEYAQESGHPERRPLNLDPGYIAEAKLVLASTKNHSHRIYLSRGIYGEITLGYGRATGWKTLPWTYPDYQRDDFQQFFTECRMLLRKLLRERPPGEEIPIV